MEPTATPFAITSRSPIINSGTVNLNGPSPPAYTPKFPYGDQPNQFGQLRTPGLLPPEAMPVHGPFPVVVLIHGGFWRDSFDLGLMAPLATDLSGRGYATWNLEYRGVGSSGGGWPETAEDIAAGIDFLAEIADEHGLDLGRVIVIGHSAGGQLALWSAARDHLPGGAPGRNPVVRPAAVVSLAGVNDLATADRSDLGAGAVATFLGRDADRTALYPEASPLELLPLGVSVLLVHGDEDKNVPISQTNDYAMAARASGDYVEVQTVSGGDHFVLIDPTSGAWDDVVRWLPLLLATGPTSPSGRSGSP
jgi:acetyl esterase/lipase